MTNLPEDDPRDPAIWPENGSASPRPSQPFPSLLSHSPDDQRVEASPTELPLPEPSPAEFTPGEPLSADVNPPAAPEPPAPPVFKATGHAVVTEYKWPAADLAASPSANTMEPESFAIVLKDGSTLSAVMVFASDDGLHYVDPDERHLCVAMSKVDRAQTLKLNRARNLNLYLPAAQ